MRRPKLKPYFEELFEFCFRHTLWKGRKKLFETIMKDLTNPDLPWDFGSLWHPSGNYGIDLYSGGVSIRTKHDNKYGHTVIYLSHRCGRKIIKFVRARNQHEALFELQALAEKATNDYIKNTL